MKAGGYRGGGFGVRERSQPGDRLSRSEIPRSRASNDRFNEAVELFVANSATQKSRNGSEPGAGRGGSEAAASRGGETLRS